MEEVSSLWHCSLGLNLNFLCVLVSDGCGLGFPLEHPPSCAMQLHQLILHFCSHKGRSWICFIDPKY